MNSHSVRLLRALAGAFVLAAVLSPRAIAGDTAPAEFFPPLPEGKRFVLRWHDEFDGDVLDPEKWDVPENQRRDGWWRKDGVVPDGKGHLALKVFKDGDKYIDGCARTRGKFEHSFGYYVTRVKLQSQPGHWPAFWLYGPAMGNIGNGGTDGAEIDIFEKPWLDFNVNHAVHWDGYAEEHRSEASKSIVPGIMKGWHTFALLWTPEEYAFYIDKQLVWRTKGGGVCRVPLYIKLSDEIGDWAGDIKKAKLPDETLIDYVRVYDIAGPDDKN